MVTQGGLGRIDNNSNFQRISCGEKDDEEWSGGGECPWVAIQKMIQRGRHPHNTFFGEQNDSEAELNGDDGEESILRKGAMVDNNIQRQKEARKMGWRVGG